MKKVINTMVLVLTMLTVSGCWGQTITVNEGTAKAEPEAGYILFVFWGIGQHKKVDAVQLCGGNPDDLIKVQTKFDILGIASQFVAGAIISPWQYKVYCKA